LPSIITHGVVGLTLGKSLWFNKFPKRFWFFAVILPIVPDLDTIGFAFGIKYHHFFGHRGFFHSIPFAFILALLTMLIFFRSEKIFSKKWNTLLIFFFIITALHGILDAMTSGGLGIALFSPFTKTRYFFPFTPIQVAPIGITAFFSEWGIRVIVSEIIWVWIPVFLIFVASQPIKKKAKNRSNKFSEQS